MANFFVRLINYFISGVGSALSWVIGLFPDSPFEVTAVPSSIDIGFITYVIPFPTMISHMAILVSAIAIYYTWRIVARWLKVARN